MEQRDEVMLKWFSFLNARQENYFLFIEFTLALAAGFMTFLFIPVAGALIMAAALGLLYYSRLSSKRLDAKYMELSVLLKVFDDSPHTIYEMQAGESFFSKILDTLKPKQKT